MVGLDIDVAIKTDQYKKEEVVAEEEKVKSWREKKMHGPCLKDLEQLDPLTSLEHGNVAREDNYRSQCSKLA